MLGLGCAGTLLLSGGKPRGGVTEAAALAALAGAAGVADAAILTEEDSFDTWENAIFSARLLLARRQRRVVVVSDAYHLPRAVLCFRAAGLTAVGSAAPGGLAGAPAAYLAATLRETAAFAGYAVKGRFRVNP